VISFTIECPAALRAFIDFCHRIQPQPDLPELFGRGPETFFDTPTRCWQFRRTMRTACWVLAVALGGFFPRALQGQPSVLTLRVANTTLQLPQSPASFGFALTNAFPGLSFNQPVCIASPPGETNRLFILEKGGTIAVITNLASPTRTVFMSLGVNASGESGLIGLAFHPGYATNRYFYVFSSRTLNTSQGNGLHQRVSRFEISPTNPNQGLANTELPLITQFDLADNHNGGDLHFGPDGYLYISVGDGGAQYDGSTNTQTITKNFFSAIMRIDVDKRPGNLLPNPHTANTTNYFIPADNPFVGRTNFNGQVVNPANIRTEFYAVGFRNPWRMSFDSVTGQLYVGDVGQDTWEEVDVVTKGGNYGWVWREGLHPGYRTSQMPAGLAYINPIQEHRHGTATNQGNSVIGGVVYRGARFSQLYGAYVFGDYTSGNIWILRYNGTNTVPFQRITGASSPVAFGTDPRNGDVLIAQLGGSIMRLEYNATQTGTPLPPTLADTGAFADLATLTPNAGIVPYSINVPFWSDNARKTRWFSVPDTNRTIGFNADANWSFPSGAVWIKHFDLELTNGVPESARRLETRFIVRNSSGVYGVTYRWDSPTNATLVPEAGLDEAFLVHDGGTTRTQVWHYPGRAECLACHTPQGGLALGFNTPQMNSEFDYGAGPENQIAALSRVGYFSTAVSNLNTLRALANPTNTAYSLDYRVHSYVAANCSQCHQPGGPSAASWDARITTPLSQAGIINGALNNDAGDTNNRVIKPGSLANSMLLSRISRRAAGQMPPIASNELDTNAIALVSAWITNGLAGYQSFNDWQLAHFGSTNAPNAQPDADPDNDGANNNLEFLTDTDPLADADAWRVGVQQTGDTVDIAFPHIANRGFQVEWAPDLQTPIVWGPLDVPSNRLFFAVSNFTANVIDTITNAPARFYRVRVSEP